MDEEHGILVDLSNFTLREYLQSNLRFIVKSFQFQRPDIQDCGVTISLNTILRLCYSQLLLGIFGYFIFSLLQNIKQYICKPDVQPLDAGDELVTRSSRVNGEKQSSKV